MISREDALRIVLDHSIDFGNESIPIVQTSNRILAEDVYADRPFPPFNRVMMDGIAFNSTAVKKDSTVLPIEKVVAAGEPQYALKNALHCVEIMTGAVLPVGCDTVVPFEDLQSIGEEQYMISKEWKPRQNIHRMGGDHPTGKVLLNAGKKLNALDIGVLATVGKSSVKVQKLPKVAIISTGDELVAIEQDPLPHQIRRSNGVMLAAYLDFLGISWELFHVNDTPEKMKEVFTEIMKNHDVLILSGGVSKGRFDYVPEVLKSLDIVQKFHRVMQRPGKPFWFGSKGRHTIFGFPGNPMSTYCCFLQYFMPWLRNSSKDASYKPQYVELGHDLTFQPHLTYFAQCALKVDPDNVERAFVQHGNGSGDLANPLIMDGLIELPADKNFFKKGEKYAYVPFHTCGI